MKGAGWCAGVMLLALTAGSPAWAACQTTQSPMAQSPMAQSPMVEGIQRELAVNGFDPGGIDGRFGPKTSEAIRAYQRAAKLPVTGCPSQELLDHVSFHLPKVYSRARPASSTPEIEVQEGLIMHGFYVGAVDGRIGARTREAIRQYQREANLPVDGQVTPELAQRLRDDRTTRAR